MVVVEKRPWVLPLIALVWLVSLIAVAALAANYMGEQGRQLSAELAVENNRLVRATELAQEEANSLVKEVASLSASVDIDRTAAEQSRATIVELQSQVEQLQAEISFYRGLMDSNAKRKDVSIGKITILPGAIPGTYRYLIVVQQVAAKHAVVTGKLSLSVLGRNADGDIALSFEDVSEQVTESSIKLKFKYFQNLEGVLELPEGFQPEWLEWQLDSSASGKSSGKQAWLLKE